MADKGAGAAARPGSPVWSRLRTGLVVALALGVGSYLVLLGCGAQFTPPPESAAPAAPALTQVPMTVLQTKDVTIRAANSSFTLQPGVAQGTPFSSGTCPAQPDTSNYFLTVQAGGQPVWVDLPERSQPLAGILLFCQVPVNATGPAARVHLVQVPQEYVDATAGGRMSVVYEPMRVPDGYGGESSVATWILYLSELPIPGLSWGGYSAAPAPAPSVSAPSVSVPAAALPTSPGSIGIAFMRTGGGELLVNEVRPGGPADDAGMLSGDAIVAVDGRGTAQLSNQEAAGALQGAPGSVAFVTVRRSGVEGLEVLAIKRQ